MNIYTVRDNLKRTIEGKEHLFRALQGSTGIVAETTAHFLHLNIDELKKILADVEKVCEKDAAKSWEGHVDRQSGAFEEHEQPKWI